MTTYTYTTTFTRTHAKHLVSKVVADLYQCYQFYDEPSLGLIEKYQEELIELLAGGYVQTYEFGFKRNEVRVVSWHYTVGPDGGLQGGDDRSGGLSAGEVVSGATFYNILAHSRAWFDMSPADRDRIEAGLPFQRSFGSAPRDGAGYWRTERTYAAGGVAVARKAFQPW